MRIRPARLLLNTILICVSVIASLGVAELAVRLVAPQQLVIRRPDIWRAEDGIGYRHWPNVHTTVNTGERTVTFASDEDGFRVGARGRLDADSRIFLIGDSMMEALQVNYEQSLAGQLEAKLRSLIGNSVVVRNAAVGGWGPSQYLMEVRDQLPRAHYKLAIVAVYLGNDIEPTRRHHYPARPADEVHRFRLPQHATWSEWVDALAYPINDALKVRSHLFILLKNGLPTLRARAGLINFEFPREYMKSEASSRRWSVTADVLRDIASVADSNGVHTLFVLLPAPFQVDSATFNAYVARFRFNPADAELDQPNEIMRPLLRERHLDVIDVLPALRKAAETSRNRLYGTVDMHLSPEGHEAVANAIAPTIANRMGAALRSDSVASFSSARAKGRRSR